MKRLILKIREDIRNQAHGAATLSTCLTSEKPRKTTQAIVKNITEIFIERNVDIQNQETADAIQFIEEQLKVYRGKIKSAEIVQLQDQLNELLVDSTETPSKRVKEIT